MFQIQINKSILCNFVLSFFTCSTWLIPGELSSYESRLSRPVYILTYLYTYIFTVPEYFWRRLFRWRLVTIATCLQIIAEKETSWLGNRGRRWQFFVSILLLPFKIVVKVSKPIRKNLTHLLLFAYPSLSTRGKCKN